MDRAELDALDGTPLVDGLANDVHDAAQSTLPNRDPDGSTSVHNLLSADETLGTVHSNGSDRILAKVSGNFENETTTMEILDFKSVEDRWEVVGLELHIYDSTNDRLDVTNSSGSLRSIRPRCKKKTRINASKVIPTAFRRALTGLVLSSAKRSGVGGGMGRRKGSPREVGRGREERVRPLGRAESLFSGARDSGEAPGC